MATHGGEGVIKYNLVFEIGPNEFSRFDIIDLMSCRQDLYRRGLIGTSGKYCDDDPKCVTVGYGNVSKLIRRVGMGRNVFAISGTRTGNISELSEDQYTTVLEYDHRKNYVSARGHIEPSSESMTHGAIYDLVPSANSVVHIHDHDERLWNARYDLLIPLTAQGVRYGTSEMAEEIERLLSVGRTLEMGIIGMEGHKDGFITWGDSVDEALSRIIQYWSRALKL